MFYDVYLSTIDRLSSLICSVADTLWDDPELGYAKKAAMYAGKAVAGTLMRLMENPAILAQAKAEHAEKTAGGYVCPLPEDLQPAIHK